MKKKNLKQLGNVIKDIINTIQSEERFERFVYPIAYNEPFNEAIKDKAYNQALDDFYNGLADELLWIRERFGDDVYMEVRCSVGCLQNRLTK